MFTICDSCCINGKLLIMIWQFLAAEDMSEGTVCIWIILSSIFLCNFYWSPSFPIGYMNFVIVSHHLTQCFRSWPAPRTYVLVPHHVPDNGWSSVPSKLPTFIKIHICGFSILLISYRGQPSIFGCVHMLPEVHVTALEHYLSWFWPFN